MYLAMCMDGSMLLSFLVFLLILGVVCCTPLVLVVIAITKWLGARRERLAADAR